MANLDKANSVVLSARISLALTRKLEIAAKRKHQTMSQEVAGRLCESVLTKEEVLLGSPKECEIAKKMICILNQMVDSYEHAKQCGFKSRAIP